MELTTSVSSDISNPYGKAASRAMAYWPSKRGYTRFGTRRDTPLVCREFPVSIGRALTIDCHLGEHPLNVTIDILELEVDPNAGGTTDIRKRQTLDNRRVWVRRNRGAACNGHQQAYKQENNSLAHGILPSSKGFRSNRVFAIYGYYNAVIYFCQ